MDRLKLTLAGCGLAALLAAPGCRSTRNEVPPGPAFSSDGRQLPPVGFGSEAHPAVGPGGAGALPGTMPAGGATGQFGTPGPGASTTYGAPTSHAYGPPDTSSLSPGSPTSPLNDPLAARPPANDPAGASSLPAPGLPGQPGIAPPSR